MEKNIGTGMKYPLQDISEKDRLMRLNENLSRGNHLIHANEMKQALQIFFDTELASVFLLPIPLNKVSELPDTEVCPVHVVKQDTIDENNKVKLKLFPCHNLSFSPRGLPNLLINQRHIEADTSDTQLGFDFEQLLN